MHHKWEDVKRELGVETCSNCGGVGCPCTCDECTCKEDVVELDKDTAALVAEFSHRELG